MRWARRAVWKASAPLRAVRDARRSRQALAHYLAATPVRKLQLGAGGTRLAGWLNTDMNPGDDAVLLDVTKPFPLPDGAFRYVLAEHLIEHVPYHAGVAMLRECHRVLEPGGAVRVATPDLHRLLDLFKPKPAAAALAYQEWILRRYVPDAPLASPVFVLNNNMRNWGHQFLHDQATLEAALRAAGFTDITWHRPGESRDPELRGLEAHGKAVDDEAMNQYETMVAEARKPA